MGGWTGGGGGGNIGGGEKIADSRSKREVRQKSIYQEREGDKEIMVVKVPGGYKIRSCSTGKLYPKLYRTRREAELRIRQMKIFGKRRKK
ncbi:MAG: hypothetical protein DDT23_00619 [candidate division WS2 bacterium]|nr:hypothetical protein [Candidatus Lithacetigena glycinireducens]